MTNRKSYLERHRGKYRVVVSVPRELHAKLGTKLKQPLGTDSLTTAISLKHQIVANLKRRIEEARNSSGRDDIRVEAEEFHRALLDADDAETKSALLDAIGDRAEQIAGPAIGSEWIGQQEEEVHDPNRWREAQRFLRIARGEATPIDTFLGQFHEEGPRSIGMKADDHRAVRAYQDWCATAKISADIESVSTRNAGRFISEALFRDKSRRTANKYISCMAAYWRWLVKKGIVRFNPWVGQFLSTDQPEEDQDQRSFTDDEIVRLLNGPAEGYLRPLMWIGALTGARIDAIASLKVRDTKDGTFRFKRQKKEAKARLVPIHSDLTEIVAELTRGKNDDDDLFPELPIPPVGSEKQRSNPAVQRFRTYRRSVGVHEQPESRRNSRVTFHSFRRWFITKAEQADIAPHIIAFVVGHKRKGVTLDIYSEGSSWDQMVRCVEAVRLPPEVRRSGQSA